jgi:hypothetical protein
MSATPIEKLVKQAREDPQFFHDLVFNTEKTLGKLDYLDRPTNADRAQLAFTIFK